MVATYVLQTTESFFHEVWVLVDNLFLRGNCVPVNVK